MRLVWWAGAAAAAALDSTRDEAILFLSRCASGSLWDAAVSTLDWQHITAFPWSNTWMVLFCLFGHSALAKSSGLRPPLWVFRVVAMAVTMPLACMASAALVSVLPLGWPSALRVSAWCLSMLAGCGALMHLVHILPQRLSSARRVAPQSSPIH